MKSADGTNKLWKFINKISLIKKSIRVKKRVDESQENRVRKSAKSYTELSESYDTYYYLNDCGGYDAFCRSDGKELDERLESIVTLSADLHDKSVLDIGCGRGELSNRLYEMGAKVVGVDYSRDAIDIASSTFSGNVGSRLKYLCEDVLTFPNEEKYDRIIMADVVEHIEQEALDALLQKVSKLLNDNGYLLIHTAPNKLFYDVFYAAKVREARASGVDMPENPRSHYENLMHINEQTPETLTTTLKQYFSQVVVWTSHDWFLEWFGKDCPYETVCSHNSIYAIAAHSADTLRRVVELVDEIRNYKLDMDEIDVEIYTDEGSYASIDKNSSVRVRVKNNGTKRIRIHAAYPINISYHIIDGEGDVMVFDGQRTRIIRDILPGDIIEQDVRIDVNNDLIDINRNFRAVITLVQEGMFWFDEIDKRFSCEVGLGDKM